MIQLYELAKEKIPELQLLINGSNGEVILNKKPIFTTRGINLEASLSAFFTGLIFGCDYKSK